MVDVMVTGTVAVQLVKVLVKTQEYKPGAVTSKFCVTVCVHAAVVLAPVNAVTVSEGDKQVRLPLSGFMV